MSSNRKRAHTPGDRGKSKQKKADKETLEVVCRLTPHDGPNPCLLLVDENTVEIRPPTGVVQRNGQPYASKQFEFGRVFDETDTQRDVFDRCSIDLIEQLLTGKNALLFTYGVTGSGKTYTMSGNSSRSQCGILPRTLDTIFNSIQDCIAEKCAFYPTGKNTFEVRSKAEARDERRFLDMDRDFDDDRFVESKKVDCFPDDYACSVFVSYVEIYNNYCYDLLDNGPVDQPLSPLDMHLDTKRQVYVGKVREVEVSSADEALLLVQKGENRRRVSDTLLNKESSRSHSVFTVKIVMAPSEDEDLYPVNDNSRVVVGQFSLVDLAGSERAKRTLNTGERLNEAAKINQSLMTLRLCFEKLRKNQRNSLQESVPYRDTKLTYLFKNYFEGTGKVRMIICANPRPDDYEENINVLSFAEESQAVQTTKGVDRLEMGSSRPPVPRRFFTAWNHEMDLLHTHAPSPPLETFAWDEFAKKQDMNALREYIRRKEEALDDDLLLDPALRLGEYLRSGLCVSDYNASILSEMKRREEEMMEEKEARAAEIKKLKRETASMRSRLRVYEEDDGDRQEREKEMRREREEEKERLRIQRGRVERTLEIANGINPTFATIRNRFNQGEGRDEAAPPPLPPSTRNREGRMADRNGYYNPKNTQRRSQSASRVLDHQPAYRIPTGNILRPKMPTNSKTTSAPKINDVMNSSAYVLTHQEVDSEGNVSTSIIKGDCIPTAGGGTAVCFNDIERLTHRSPAKTTTRL